MRILSESMITTFDDIHINTQIVYCYLYKKIKRGFIFSKGFNGKNILLFFCKK